jgi:N utilization substance protein A
MAVALGEGEVKTVEDLAGLVSDDLRGWFETKDGQRVREAGMLEAFNLEPADAEALIMRARVAMGWVEAPPEPEFEPEAEPSEDSQVFAQAEAEGEARDA